MRVSRRYTEPYDEGSVQNIMEATGVNRLIARLLVARGRNTVDLANEFLYDTSLSDPFAFHDMEKAVRIIRTAIKEEKPILVYGDYDCDGICAAALLVGCLQRMGAKVEVYIPNRETEGYGLHISAIGDIAKRASLLITVDCGISANEEIAHAKELGMQVILTDHHMPPEILPDADAILCAKVQCPPRAEHLCGCGMAFKLACALEMCIRDRCKTCHKKDLLYCR